jgi:hypothetical protein
VCSVNSCGKRGFAFHTQGVPSQVGESILYRNTFFLFSFVYTYGIEGVLVIRKLFFVLYILFTGFYRLITL